MMTNRTHDVCKAVARPSRAGALALLAAVGFALPAAAQQQNPWQQQQRQQDPWQQQNQQNQWSQQSEQFGQQQNQQLRQRLQQLGQQETWQQPQRQGQRQQTQKIFQEIRQLGQQTGQQGGELPMGWIVVSYDLDGDAQFDAHELIHVSDIDEARYATRQRKQQANTQTGASVGALSPIVRQISMQQQQQQFGGQQQVQQLKQQLRQMGQQQKQQLAQEAQQIAQQYGEGMQGLPSGWVLASFDIEGDGQYEIHELIHVNDLDEARFNTRQRKQQAGVQIYEQRDQFSGAFAPMVQNTGMTQQFGQQDTWRQQQQFGQQDPWRQQSQQSQMQPMQPMQQTSQQVMQIQGEISDVSTIRLANMREDHLVAKVKTNTGQTIPVDLGAREDIRRLNLREGSKVSVVGVRGEINQRPVLMASQVEMEGKLAVVDRPLSKPLMKVEGEVLNTQTARIYGADEDHVIARVRTDDGQMTLVDLGPRSKLRQANISSGQRITLLASPGAIDGQQAFLAQQLQVAGGRIIDVERVSDRLNLQTQRSQTAGVQDDWDF